MRYLKTFLFATFAILLSHGAALAVIPTFNGSVNNPTNATVTAAGTTQGTATAIAADINVVVTTPASSGVLLPALPGSGRVVTVFNKGVNALNVYPQVGASINALSADTPYSIPAGATLEFSNATSTQWYTISPVIGTGACGVNGTNTTVSGAFGTSCAWNTVPSPSFSGVTLAGQPSGYCLHTTSGGAIALAAGDCGLSGGGITGVSASAPLASSGGTSPNISLTGIIAQANGGTGTASPSCGSNGTNTTVSGSFASSCAWNVVAAPTIQGTNFSVIPNSALLNSAITVTAGSGLSGGGSASLGSSVTLSNAGVTSAIGTPNQVSVSAATGAVTFSLPQSINSGAAPTFAGTNFSAIPNGALSNSTISGIPLGSNLANLLAGAHFTQGSYNGSSPITLALDATSANTPSTIVSRDSSGNFAGGTVTATLFSGSGASLTNIPNAALLNTKGGYCRLSADEGAYGDDSHDDSAALNAALAAWQAGTCNVIVLDKGKTYLINEAIEPTFSVQGGFPYQKPLRITSDGGPEWNGYLEFFGDGPAPSTGTFDLRYDGSDLVHPAKIDTRGSGFLEIDHITIEDKAADEFPFFQTTNTTIYFHDNKVNGDPANSGTANRQDFAYLGNPGNWAATTNITSGSHTLTIGGGDPPFNSGMVGWTINYGADKSVAGNHGSTISAYVSPTQVTLTDAAAITVTNGVANYFAIGSDKTAPFEGFNSRFVHNTYSHIRRALIWENYANAVVAQDEAINESSGCAASNIPNCAPYYFDKSSTFRFGNIIRNPLIETTYYPYAVYMGSYVSGSNLSVQTFDGGANNVGAYYFELSTVQNNNVDMSTWQPYQTYSGVNTTVAASISSGSQTVTPASMTNITTATPLLIDASTSGAQEWVTPSATTGTTFTATFVNSHGTNSTVQSTPPYVAGAGVNATTVLSNGAAGVPTQFASPVTLGLNLNPTNVLGPLNIGTAGSLITNTAGLLTLNTIAGSGQTVNVNYNNTATGGLRVYNGDTTTYSTYGATSAAITGQITATAGLDLSGGAVTASGSNVLRLNSVSGAGQAVFVNYNNSATGGLQVYDGGTTNHVTLAYNNLSASSLVATDGSMNLTSTVSGLSPTFTALTLSSGPLTEGSSTYGPTIASVNGGVFAGVAAGGISSTFMIPDITAGWSTEFPNTNEPWVTISNNATGHHDISFVSAYNDTILASFAQYNNSGTWPIASEILHDGTYSVGSSSYGPASTTVNGSITGTGNIQAKNTSDLSCCLTTGDLGAGRSSTTGVLWLGGASTHGELDYGLSHAGAYTLGAGGVFMPNLTTSGSAQTDNLCLSSGNEVIADTAGCLVSSERFKNTILPLSGGLDDVLALKPVSFYYDKTGNLAFDSDPNRTSQQMGFVAEQAQAIDPRLVATDQNGDVHAFKYENYTAQLTLAIQQQQAQIRKLQCYVTALSKHESTVPCEARPERTP